MVTADTREQQAKFTRPTEVWAEGRLLFTSASFMARARHMARAPATAESPGHACGDQHTCGRVRTGTACDLPDG